MGRLWNQVNWWSWAVELWEDVDFIICFGGGVGGGGERLGFGGGFFDSDEMAAAEDGFVDEAMIAFAEEFLVGEAIGGSFEL